MENAVKKVLNFSYEDLVLCAFIALLLTDEKNDIISIEQLENYKDAIIEYCMKNKWLVEINSKDEEKEKFRQNHSEFSFDEDTIKITNRKKFNENNIILFDDKYMSIFLNNAVIESLNVKKQTLS